MTSDVSDRSPERARRALAPLYLAGFTTAFGAHGVASVLGAESEDVGLSLLGLGVALALYDLAEVVLKPFFGALSDRIGPKPVIVGGLVAFAGVSLVAVIHPSSIMLALVRLGQGAAASAFSPASSSAVARIAGRERLGRLFGRYGGWKSLGYVLGPVIGVALAHFVGLRAVYVALAVPAAVAAIWSARVLPRLPVAPRARFTVADLVRQTRERGFLIPTIVLATSTGILGVAVGFIPLLATRHDLHPVAGAAAVALLALTSAASQPVIGRLRDEGRVNTATGSGAGLLLSAAALLLLAVTPGTAALFVAAAAIGLTIGIVTPLAFAHLAAVTPDERMGRTMGNAELGRELGDAGGPLLVGAIASAATLAAGLTALAAVSAAAGAVGWLGLRPRPTRPPRSTAPGRTPRR
ncbi:MAG TPA: MFS transporter [Miltoncostaea sp.]|nr:MFS transporter [Miltoncostaea sp.]